MQRLSNAIMDGQIGSENTPMTNPNVGAQYGHLPEMVMTGADGVAGLAVANSKNYIRRNVTGILLQPPGGFKYFGPEKAKELTRTLQTLIEKAPINIEGLNATLEVQTEESLSGLKGQMWEDPNGTNRQRSDVTITYKDKEGVPYRRFFDFYIRYLIEDPDVELPLVTTLESFNGNDKPVLWTPDYYGFSAMFFETDITKQHVIECFTGVNLFPHSAGNVMGSKTQGTSGTAEDMSIRYGGLFLSNSYARSAGQKMLNSMSIFKRLPDMAIKSQETRGSAVSATGDGFDVYKN